MPSSDNIKVYKNSDVVKVVGFIPLNHRHMRLVLVLKDQAIVLHEATVAAIARAYINIVSHPTRRAIEYVQVPLAKGSRKPNYAEHQLIEQERDEEDIIHEWCKALNFSDC